MNMKKLVGMNNKNTESDILFVFISARNVEKKSVWMAEGIGMQDE